MGDAPETVARNRADLAARPEIVAPEGWIWVSQVHGTAVFSATTAAVEGAAASGRPPVADASETRRRGLALAIVTADCAPLVVASDESVAVVHAGHPGVAHGVIEAAIARVRSAGNGDVRAFLGPCIRAPRYEFGRDDLDRFVSQFGPSVEARTHAGRPALDIPAAIRVVLDREGVVEFEDCGICTADSPGYFSYRRDGQTGRQATIAVLT